MAYEAMEKDKQVSFRISGEMRDVLERIAQAEGRPLSNLLVKILDQWISAQGLEPACVLYPNHKPQEI